MGQGYYFSGISGNLEMSENLAKVREKSDNLCSQGNLIVAAQQKYKALIYVLSKRFL